MAGPPAVPHDWRMKQGYQETSNPVEIGLPIAAIDTPKTIWATKDDDGDILAACRVTATDLTAGTKASKIEFLGRVGGNLVVMLTLDSAEGP